MAATVISAQKTHRPVTGDNYVSGSFKTASDGGDATTFDLTGKDRVAPERSLFEGLGFRPRKVVVWKDYEFNGTTWVGTRWEWHDGMVNGSVVQDLPDTPDVTSYFSANGVTLEGTVPALDSYENADYDKDAASTPANNFNNVNTPGEKPDHKVTLGTNIVTANGTYSWQAWK